jgi:excinuclease ABC subunit B
MEISRAELIRKFIDVHYERTNADLTPGQFRALGNSIEIMPVSDRYVIRINFDGNIISEIIKMDDVSRAIISVEDNVFVFPAKHFITDADQQKRAIETIKAELKEQLKQFEKEGKILEAERIKRRTNYDLAMIKEVGYCNGIENYSRHFSGKMPGEAADTLLSYFPHNKDGSPDFLTIIDESHVSIPQIGGMFAGDASRKQTLVEHGFRLPSAKDNRPLKFDEFEQRVGQVVYTTATPGKYEIANSEQVVQQVIRPTGLIDPIVEVKPIISGGTYKGQIFDFIEEAEKVIKKGSRVIATTLTKKMAEDLSEYLKEKGIKATYVHSDIKTIERIEILTAFRRGEFDILVGVNLLREGLDLPEVSMIGILDADKEGFLRSETSLIQIIGRAARNIDGRVILYADHMTGSMERAMNETKRRRQLQMDYNTKHGITPITITKKIHDITEHMQTEHKKAVGTLLSVDKVLYEKDPAKLIAQKEKEMLQAVKELDFETAAILRDEIKELTGENPKKKGKAKKK